MWTLIVQLILKLKQTRMKHVVSFIDFLFYLQQIFILLFSFLETLIEAVEQMEVKQTPKDNEPEKIDTSALVDNQV